MSETVDLTLLSAGLQGIEREMRLVRVQLDQLAGVMPHRLTSIEARLGVLEQSAHGLASEVARGVSQQQQQITRLEKRLETLDGGLTALRAELADSTERIIRAMGREP